MFLTGLRFKQGVRFLSLIGVVTLTNNKLLELYVTY